MINDKEFFLWTSDEQKRLESELLNKISLDKAWKHVVWLTENALPRMSGTPGERKAVDYIKKTFEEYGLPVTIYEFDAQVGIPGEGQLKVISPETREIECQAQAHSICPPEGIKGTLIFVGAGTRDDIELLDISGKIVLAEARGGASIPEIARYVEDGGAIGLVLGNWAEHLLFYSTKYVMGNPAPHQMDQMPHIPAVSIKGSDFTYLKSQLEQKNVQIWMYTTGDDGWKKTVQPLAVLEADDPSYALLAGHHDAWGGGVICNATGAGFILELARVLAQFKGKFKRSLKIGFWSGHENGMCSGSIWYLDNMWNDVKRNMLTTYTVDSPGHIDQPLHRTVNTVEIRDFHEKCIKDTLPKDQIEIPLSYPDSAKVGDSMFFPWDVGTPAIWDGKRNSGTYPEWHSKADTLDKGRPEILLNGLKVFLVSISRLLNSPILPFNFSRLIDEYKRVLNELQEFGKEKLDLKPILNEVNILGTNIESLNSKINSIMLQTNLLKTDETIRKSFDIMNSCLIKLGRILNPLFFSEAPFHDYDPYGSEYPQWIPSLQPIKKLGKLNIETDEFKVIYTGLKRQCNRITDGLQDASELIEESLEKIKLIGL